jgi:hypothetical protein
MGFPYTRLADIRIGLSPGQESVVPREQREVSVRPPQPGDFTILLRDAEEKVIDEEREGRQDVSSGLLQHSSDFEFRKPFVSARTARDQLLHMLEGIRHRHIGQQEHQTIIEDASNTVSSSTPRSAVVDEDKCFFPNAFMISRHRWEARWAEERFACSFDPIRILVLQPDSQDDLIRCEIDIALYSSSGR